MTTKLVRIWRCLPCKETVTITVEAPRDTAQVTTQDLLLATLQRRHKMPGCDLRTGDCAEL